MTVEVGADAGNSVVKMVANIFISFIGAGVLGLPYAFKEAGLMEGVLVMGVTCYLAVKAMLLLIECKNKVEGAKAHDNDGAAAKKTALAPGAKVSNGKEYVQLAVEEEDSGGSNSSEKDVEIKAPVASSHPTTRITYSDVGYAAFGSKGRLLIDTTLLLSQVGFCCGYLIFISENLATVIHGVTQTQWLFIIVPPTYFLTLIPDLANLAVFSIAAQAANVFAFAVVFWYDFANIHLASSEHRKEFSLTGFPFFFSVAIYCFEGAGMILSLEQSVSESLRPSFPKYLVGTVISVTVLYASFGCFGFLSFGTETKDIITLNLPHDTGVDAALMVKACLCFSLFFTYPIMMFPVTTLLEERLCAADGKPPVPYFGHLLRLGLVASTVITVLVVPKFSVLMALIGATCCTLLAFIMPGACHMVLFSKTTDVKFNYVLIGTGVVGAIVGMGDVVVKIMYPEEASGFI